MGKSPIVKEKVQQIWAYVLHIRQKKRSNGRMLEIMSINQCFPKYYFIVDNDSGDVVVRVAFMEAGKGYIRK